MLFYSVVIIIIIITIIIIIVTICIIIIIASSSNRISILLVLDRLVGPVANVSALRATDQGPVSWRPTKWQQFSQSNRHSTIGTRQTEYHEVLPSSANEVRCDCTFTDDGNASWYSGCRVPMVEWTVKTVVIWRSSASMILAPGLESRLHRGCLSGSSQTSDLKIGTEWVL